MTPRFPLFRPPALTGRYLAPVLDSRWLTTGPECERLRQDLAAKFKWDPAAIVLGSSATACWQAWIDVTCPCDVFITEATWPGMLHVADKWVDPRGDTSGACWVDTCIGGASIVKGEERLPRVMLEPEHRVLDACHSWLPDPAYDASLVSFYPTKLVPGAEGGALFLSGECVKLADQIEVALNCGQVPAHRRGNAALRSGFGRKGNMTDVQAALNREALERHDQYVEDIEWAFSLLASEAVEAGVPYREQGLRAYLFQVECAPDRVQPTREALAERGIPTAWNFPPAGLVTLPCYPGLTNDEAKEIILAVKECL